MTYLADFKGSEVTTKVVNGTNITTIPPRKMTQEYQDLAIRPKKRVGAYARVSTKEEEQQNSYEAQVKHYTEFIKEHSDWDFVEVYADEGKTGTSTKSRKHFMRMVDDAMAGKLDLILTKSVSRFARNTVDSLITIRALKEKGVEIYFEKENIYTMDAKGELLITLMSSLAQEESRSISENVTWGIRKRFADGKVTIAYKHFLGYQKGADGKPEIVETEAEIVRNIFRWFSQGMSPSAIAKRLTSLDIPSPGGKPIWRATTARSILTNEKYKGDALLQKTYIVDFLTKKAKINEGEISRYYVENSHPAIIEPDEFDEVQVELAQRESKGERTFSSSPFSMKLICADCGSYFGPKVWQSNTKYRRTIWRCNKKYEKGSPCSTKHLNEEGIKASFLKALMILNKDSEELATVCDLMVEELCDCSGLEHDAQKIQTELDGIECLLQGLADDRARGRITHDEFIRIEAANQRSFEELSRRLQSIQSKRQMRRVKATALNNLKDKVLCNEPVFTELDETLWYGIVEKVMVNPDGVLDFHFINGVVVNV